MDEKCDALAQKYTSLEDRVFNNEACLGEVEEAKIASDMKFDTLDTEIESLKKEIDRLEGFSAKTTCDFSDWVQRHPWKVFQFVSGRWQQR